MRLIAMVTGHVPRHLPSRLSPSFFPRLPQEDDTGSFCVSPPLPENSLVWMLNNHEVTDLHPPTSTSHPLNNCLLFIASCPSMYYSPSHLLSVKTNREVSAARCLFPHLISGRIQMSSLRFVAYLACLSLKSKLPVGLSLISAGWI